MIGLLELVVPMEDAAVPPASILREFIGQSIFETKPAQKNSRTEKNNRK